jgi:PAS domain S-box-containing protein
MTSPLIFVTGQGNEKLAAKSFRAGASDYFTKEESFAHYDRLLNSIRREADIYINSRELRLAEENYKTLYEHAISGIFKTSVNGQLIECNKSFRKMLGYAPGDDLSGLDVKEWYWNEKEREHYIQSIRKLGKINNYELHLRSRYGKDIWLLNNAVLLDEEIIQGTVIDITDRKLAELSLERSEEKLRTLVDYFPISVQIFSLDGTLVNANQAYGKLWGLDDHRKAFGVYNLLEDEQVSRSQMKDAFLRARAGEAVDLPPFKYDPEKSDFPGRERTVKCRLYPLKNQGENIENVVLTTEDYSGDSEFIEYIKTEKNLLFPTPVGAESCAPSCKVKSETNTSEYLCDLVIRNTVDLLFIKDIEGRYLRVNDALLKAFNLEKNDILGKRDDVLFDEENFRSIAADDQEVLKGKTTKRIRSMHFEDRTVKLQVVKTPYYDKSGEVAGILGVARDLTDEIKREEQLQEVNGLLKASNQELQAFSYSLSHDLRGPHQAC